MKGIIIICKRGRHTFIGTKTIDIFMLEFLFHFHLSFDYVLEIGLRWMIKLERFLDEPVDYDLKLTQDKLLVGLVVTH